MTVVPAEIPFTKPVYVFISATAILLLLQVPLVTESESLVPTPIHKSFGPTMSDGTAFTVTCMVEAQPVLV